MQEQPGPTGSAPSVASNRQSLADAIGYTGRPEPSYPQPMSAPAPRATPTVVPVLHQLAEAAHLYAAKAEEYIAARDGLNDARSRFQLLREQAAKEAESEQV